MKDFMYSSNVKEFAFTFERTPTIVDVDSASSASASQIISERDVLKSKDFWGGCFEEKSITVSLHRKRDMEGHGAWIYT